MQAEISAAVRVAELLAVLDPVQREAHHASADAIDKLVAEHPGDATLCAQMETALRRLGLDPADRAFHNNTGKEPPGVPAARDLDDRLGLSQALCAADAWLTRDEANAVVYAAARVCVSAGLPQTLDPMLCRRARLALAAACRRQAHEALVVRPARFALDELREDRRSARAEAELAAVFGY